MVSGNFLYYNGSRHVQLRYVSSILDMPPIHIVHNKNCQKRTDSRKRWRTTGSQTLMLYVLTFNKNVPSHSHLCTLSEQTILFDICSLLLFMVCIPRTITTDSVLSHWVFHWSGLLDNCLGLEYHLYYLKNLRSWGHIANYVKQKRAAAASLITCYSVDGWSCIYCLNIFAAGPSSA